MRATSFRSSVTHARRMDASCLASATAWAVTIAAERSWANVEDTGLAWSPVTDSLLSRSAEDAKSTKEGVTCLFSATTVTSPWSVLEVEYELKEVDEPYPSEWPLTPYRCPPLPPPELLSPPRLPCPKLPLGSVQGNNQLQMRLLRLRHPMSPPRPWWRSLPPLFSPPHPPWPLPPPAPPPPRWSPLRRSRLSPRCVFARRRSSCSSSGVGHRRFPGHRRGPISGLC